MQLNKAVGIVTGGANGFGKAFAERILNARGKVLITDIQEEKLAVTGKELQQKYGKHNVLWMVQDVLDSDGFIRAFDLAAKYFEQPVNLLVNNAGIAGNMAFFSSDMSDVWKKVIDIDLTSVIRGTQVAIQKMKDLPKGPEGVVVNIASFAGLGVIPWGPVYAAAKGGVVHFTRSCFPYKQQFGVRVVSICPAYADTAMGRTAMEHGVEDVKRSGLMPVEEVVDAFVQSVEDPNNCGRALRVSHGHRSYHVFPGDKKRYPNAKL
ncbi:TPA: hypothetical protein N0F65_011451 [Lagenidium giganteum]|uniref:Uncharacterized protein n=1 Tax=Lagenidium giganteum TaxID=4803 RepID=A0AAV2ZC42_9STRA|nr:TPA: hypothetical protein N0F65_011451 [Lagenidium giganteum]